MKFMAKVNSPLHISSINIIVDITLPPWPLDTSIRPIFEKGQVETKQVFSWRLMEMCGWRVVFWFGEGFFFSSKTAPCER